MILLSGISAEGPRQAVAVFGAGLIGSAVARALSSHAAFVCRTLRFAWQPASLGQDLAAVEEEIAAELLKVERNPPRLGFLWSAGRAGFSAGSPETTDELESFRAVLALAARLAARFRGAAVTFHLISSAGGLFEGQRLVGADAAPAPRRAYSFLKQQQEDLLAASPLAGRVYRLSSVYGWVAPGHRIGLVSVLLLNGIRRLVTPISGWMSTQRDFVFVEDVADFVARAILSDDASPGLPPYLLAQGRPSSIWEVQRLVEAVLGHRIYVSYSLRPDNGEDTTFSRAALPLFWRPSDLGSNIRRIYREALRSGAAFSRPVP